MSWTNALLAGLAQMIADAGIGTYRAPDDPYQPGDEWPIFTRGLLPDPDAVIGLTPYGGTADAGLSDVTQPVQILIRGPRDDLDAVNDIGDLLFELLHGLNHPARIGGIPIVQITRRSVVPMGTDQSGRPEQAHNYYIQAVHQTATRQD